MTEDKTQLTRSKTDFDTEKGNAAKKAKAPKSENGINSSKEKKASPQRTSSLAVLSIILTLGLAVWLYYHGHQQIVQQNNNIVSLQNEIAHLKQVNPQFSSITEQMNQQFLQQKVVNEQLNSSTVATNQNIAQLNERLNAMSSVDMDKWLISQANYLIHLAGRKIWNEQDYTTALMLLKSADQSLAEAHDASLIPARKAISNDIAAISKLSVLDSDGLIMNLMRLSDALTELPLVSHYNEFDLGMTKYQDQPSENQDNLATQREENTNTVSNSVTDWPQNLIKSAAQFFQKFVTVRKIHPSYDVADCLNKADKDQAMMLKCKIMQQPINPDDALYLRENIRLRLLIAAQAIPRHQDLIYQRALNDVDIWINAYFNDDSNAVKSFLNELSYLQQQSISNKEIPERLSSSIELEKMMHSRVLSMMVK